MISTQQENDIFQDIWNDLLDKNQIPVEKPHGVVLGGQPGAGKSALLQQAEKEQGGNLIIINGDTFREYHPRFEEIQAEYGRDAPTHTAPFAAKMTERVLAKATDEGYNIAIEGTFRTADTPIKTLQGLKDKGYSTAVYVKATPATVSWERTKERYNKAEAAGLHPRHVPEEFHDKVVAALPENVDKVFQSGLADNFRIYSDTRKLYDSAMQTNQKPSEVIRKELNRNVQTQHIREPKIQKQCMKL
ncbi:MAG: zeta toxin family protein [Neisseria animaloris]|nr:zeta toxin family protein [Neisseria animaloris]